MRCPAEVYVASDRPYRDCQTSTITSMTRPSVTTCGRISFNRKKINLSQVFAGQTIGISQVEDHLWLATFMHYDLGYFDD
jgi:putative transposase